MRFVTMDDEGRDLLEAAGEMAHAALEARAARVDPEGIISRSVNMSRIKTQTVLDQLRQPPLADWTELDEADRSQFLTMCANMAETGTVNDAQTMFKAIRSICLRRAPVQRTSAEVEGKASVGVSTSVVASDAEVSAARTSKVRRKLRGGGGADAS